jgi:hypothetical protein
MNGGGFGKLGSEWSCQHDNLAKYKVTIGGQIKFLMFIDRLIYNGIKVLSVNTDGAVIRYYESQRQKVQEIHNEWEQLTGFQLEDTFYSSIHMTSVNDYIATIIDPKTNKVLKIKYKGDFEIDKDLHKDHSMRIVPLAVARDLMFRVPYSQTIRDHLSTGFYEDLKVENHGIYDLCKAVRSKGGARFELFSRRTIMEPIPLPKTVRYYMSKSGMSIRKILPPDPNKKGDIERFKEKHPDQLSMFDFVDDVRIDLERPSEVEAGNDVIIFNKYVEGHYDLDIAYYENECKKIIDKIR